MSSALPAIPTAARSMLEEMLAALKLKDEKPKDVPPALPSRPTLRRRPPSAKHILSTKLKIDEAAECSQKGSDDTPKENTRSGPTEFSNGVNGTVNVGKAANFEVEELDCYKEVSKGGCNGCVQEDPGKNNQKVQHSSLEELEKLAIIIKENLRQKEEENAALLQQVQEYEKKWSQCEEKLNSMEEIYQKQLEALKMSLAEAQKTIAAAAAADTIEKPGKFNYEGAKFAAARTPEEAPARHYVSSAPPPTRDADDRNNVQQLAREFEKQKQVFEAEVRALDAPKSGQQRSAREAMDELRKLKSSYKAWKKEYKVRVRDTKKSLVKLAKSSSAEKPRRRWWCSCKCYKKNEKK